MFRVSYAAQFAPGVTKWPNTPNEETRVSGHFNWLEMAGHAVNNLQVHKARVLGHFTPQLKQGDMGVWLFQAPT